MQNCRPIGTPASKDKLVKGEGERLSVAETESYRSSTGSLMYLSVCTRPDIAQSVGVLGRFMQEPTDRHMTAAKHVLRYLAGTKEMGILFGAGERGISVYSDADWGGELDTRRSTTGYVVVMDGAAVAWSSHLQRTVAVSTQEAEYQALAAAARMALSVRKILADFGIGVQTVKILSDNQAALCLAENPMVQARSKHIDIQHHFVRDRISRNEISVSYISTSLMIADVLTKALDPARVKVCREGMGLI